VDDLLAKMERRRRGRCTGAVGKSFKPEDIK